MRLKTIAAVSILVLFVYFSWSCAIKVQNDSAKRIDDILQEIEFYKDIGVSKNLTGLYLELINIDGENISWYTELADSYLKTGRYSEYIRICNSIITKFPENKIGYVMLAEFYQDDNRHDKVIELYKRLPKTMSNDPVILDIYSKSEYMFRYVSRSYDGIFALSNTYAIVMSQNLYSYTDSNASEAFPVWFEAVRPFVDHTAAVYDNNEWFYIDADGDRVLASKERIDDLYSFSEGYAVAKIQGAYGYIDARFEKIHFGYDYATNFFNGTAAVRKNEKWALINNKFEHVTDFVFEDIIIDEFNLCSRRGIVFAKMNNGYSMVDLKGNSVSDARFDDARLFVSEGPAAVMKNGYWGFVDIKGQMVIDFNYEDARSFSQGLAAVKINGYWGFIDTNNNMVIDNEFEDAGLFNSDGVTYIKTGGVYRFIQLLKYSY